jgi:ATP-binding cassette subfamily F protein 3
MTNLAKQAESVEAKKKHMQMFVDKFRFNAKRASLVQSRLKAIERLGEVQMGVRSRHISVL